MSNEGRVWFNGKLRESSECLVHVAAHALHYGSSVFEGIRAYDTPDGTMIFRLRDHLKRLKYSADVYRIPLHYSVDELHAACRETVRDSGLKSVYIRPIVFRGNCGLGVMPRKIDIVDVAIMVSPWGAYLGEEGLKNGIKACINSWNRLAPNTMPPGVKAGGIPVQPVDRLRGARPRFRGRHRARHRRPAERGRGRKLSGGQEPPAHASGRCLHPQRDHPRHANDRMRVLADQAPAIAIHIPGAGRDWLTQPKRRTT